MTFIRAIKKVMRLRGIPITAKKAKFTLFKQKGSPTVQIYFSN